MVLGCPSPGSRSYEPQGGYLEASAVRHRFDKLLGEVEKFASPALFEGSLTAEGKRGEIESLLDSCTVALYGSKTVQAGATPSTSACPVVVDRVAVPEKAGLVDPCEWLEPGRAQVVANLHTLRLPEELWREIVVACHHVPPAEEAGLVRKLLEREMVVLLPESDLPRNQAGDLMVGGLFSVEKNEKEDRLIYDRRPENATMRQLGWAGLPSGA